MIGRTRQWVRRGGLGTILVSTLLGVMLAHGAPGAEDEPKPVTAEGEIQRIMGAKDAAVQDADKQYATQVESADEQYEKDLSEAQASRAKAIAKARLLAAVRLKAAGRRMAAAGQVVDAIKLFRAVHRLRPGDAEATAALAAAGVEVAKIELEPDYEARRLADRGHKIVIWNTHNSRYNTSGALECNVLLLKGKTVAWRSDKVALPWKRGTDTFATVLAPPKDFDTVRVEITKWQGYSGGLAEIEVWKGKDNIAIGRPVRASAALDNRTLPTRLTDGVTTSSVYKNGYWLLPDNQAGWVEVSLARPEYSKVHRAKISARKPWQKVLKVLKGDVIDITATGMWRAHPQILANADGGMDARRDEHGEFRHRFYLRGRLGGKAFRIGSKFALHVAQDGELEMGMNEDKAEWHTNNSGFLDVTLTVRKKPDAAPTSGPTSASATGGKAAKVATGS